jgi:hypothetical protein
MPLIAGFSSRLLVVAGGCRWLDHDDQRQQEQHHNQGHYHRRPEIVAAYRLTHLLPPCLSRRLTPLMRTAYAQGVSWLLAGVAIKWLFLLPTLEEMSKEYLMTNSATIGLSTSLGSGPRKVPINRFARYLRFFLE